MASIRILLSALLRIVAAALLLITCATPFFLREDVEENREIVSTFEAAAAYAHAHQAARGRLPTGDELRRWGEGQELGWSASSLSIGGEGCGQEGFVAAPGDRFVLSVWRGEWFECFASPSGRHSLPMSVGAYLTVSGGDVAALLPRAGTRSGLGRPDCGPHTARLRSRWGQLAAGDRTRVPLLSL